MGQKRRKKTKAKTRPKNKLNPVVLGGGFVILALCLHAFYTQPEVPADRSTGAPEESDYFRIPRSTAQAGSNPGTDGAPPPKNMEFDSFDSKNYDPNAYSKNEITADYEADAEIDPDDEERVAAAADLIAFMVNKSMLTLHVPVQVLAKPGRGLGVFAKEKVDIGKPVITVAPSAMLWSKTGVRLAVQLATQYKKPRDRLMELYLKTLPEDCPNNILHPLRPAADRDLVRKTRMYSVVESGQKDDLAFAEVTKALGFSTQEMQWAKCTALSRATRHFEKTVMVPFLDLINHGTSSRKIWHPEHGTTVVSSVNIPAGGEVTFEYTSTPSQLEMLTIWGFPDKEAKHVAASIPATAILANDLQVESPQHYQWLRNQGCPVINYMPAGQDLSGMKVPKGYGKKNQNLCRTDLYVDPRGGMHQDQLRFHFRCLRLRMYTFREAKYAVKIGHLNKPWGGGDNAKPAYEDDREKLLALLDKDGATVTSAGVACHHRLPPEKQKELEDVLAKKQASMDLGGAVLAELGALTACAALSNHARDELVNALGKLEVMVGLPAKPASLKAKEEAEDDDEDVDDAAGDAPAVDVKTVLFPDKSLGLRMEKGNAEAFVNDKLFNARIQTVKAKEAIAQGVKAGDVLVAVGEWPAEGASIKQVVSQIKLHKERPLQIQFATPSDDDDFEF